MSNEITTQYDPTNDWAGVNNYAYALKAPRHENTSDDLIAKAVALYGHNDPAYSAKCFIGPIRKLGS